MVRIIVIHLIFCCLLTSCRLQKFVGEYRYAHDLVTHELRLNADSTFEYIVRGDLSIDTSVGKWYVGHSSLYLNSFSDYWPYQVIEKEEQGSELAITLKDLEGVSIPGNYITLNETSETKYYIDSVGEIRIPLPDNTQKTIEIHSINGKFTYEIKNPKSNRFEITYDSGKASYLYFDNQKLNIKRNKLVDSQGQLILKKHN